MLLPPPRLEEEEEGFPFESPMTEADRRFHGGGTVIAAEEGLGACEARAVARFRNPVESAEAFAETLEETFVLSEDDDDEVAAVESPLDFGGRLRDLESASGFLEASLAEDDGGFNPNFERKDDVMVRGR